MINILWHVLAFYAGFGISFSFMTLRATNDYYAAITALVAWPYVVYKMLKEWL